MKKYLIILVALIFISCESVGLGVEEFQAELTYFEYVGFGWQHFFDENYDVAIEYFNVALESEDEEYHNSAQIGLGWSYLMKSNLYIGEETTVDIWRNLAYEKFSYDTDEALAISSYSINCEYAFCCDSCFVNDKNVGMLYKGAIDYLNSENYEDLDTSLVESIQNFIDQHSSDATFYNFMDGKPESSNENTFNLTTDNITILLAQIYMRNNNFYCAMDLLFENELCLEYNLYDTNCCNVDCEDDVDALPIIECIENHTNDF